MQRTPPGTERPHYALTMRATCGVNGKVVDLYLHDGKLVKSKKKGKIQEVIDVNGKVIMAGGIDAHTHIYTIMVRSGMAPKMELPASRPSIPTPASMIVSLLPKSVTA